VESGLKGKIVLITGAASGIGAATTRAFAAEGAQLALLDANEKGLLDVAGQVEASSPKVAMAVADLSTHEGVEQGVKELLSVYGGELDVLVNNVGAAAVRTFDETTDDDWHEMFEINFLSYVRTIRATLPNLRARPGACIVNNASDIARQPEPNPLDYAVAKAAVLALTKGLARSEGPGVRVNAVAPGAIWTPFWTKPGGFADRLAKLHNMPPREAVEHEISLQRMPLGRLGKPEEVANVIVFLASDLATFVTGSVYGVDGGSIRSIVA
jgi:NAD(P)-dependent dehydrogenase (short-subunit alcohol dehydrogenase family)